MGYVQSRTASVAASPRALAYTSAVTQGSLLIVCVFDDTSTPTSVSSSVDGALAQVGSTVNVSGVGNCSIWIKENASAGAATITVTRTGAFIGMQILEYSGMAASSSFDKSANGTGASTTPTTAATATTTQASEIAIGFAFDNGSSTWAAGTGYTLREPNANGQFQVEEQVLSATGAQTASWTLLASDWWGATVATFIVSSGAAPPTGIRSLRTPLWLLEAA